MTWRNLLDQHERSQAMPWLCGRILLLGVRAWKIVGDLPDEHGWYTWQLHGREASDPRSAEPDLSVLRRHDVGYLVGDIFISEQWSVPPIKVTDIMEFGERVHLLPDGLDLFARIRVGNVAPCTPLVYCDLQMPTGAEDDVLEAYLDRLPDLRRIKHVTPALDLAFRMESQHRANVETRRAELERLRREEEERLAKEAKFKELAGRLGDGAGRRAMAKVDFAEAARAALAVGGATLLDVRNGQRGEKVVRYRIDRQRLECVVDALTLRCIDSGCCLTDHDTGEKGDTFFTLESLPGVVREAQQLGKLVIYRHV